MALFGTSMCDVLNVTRIFGHIPNITVPVLDIAGHIPDITGPISDITGPIPHINFIPKSMSGVGPG